LGLFSELPLYVADEKLSKLEGQLEQIEIDFEFKDKQQLIRVVTEIEQNNSLPVDDGYVVPVRLKDNSVYAFAPRRFAHCERLELRQITDDLLK